MNTTQQGGETMISVNDFINNSKKYLGYHYLYGYKGETITKEKNEQLTAQYPKIWKQSSYKTKANKWIGEKALDCSGLICRSLGWAIGKDIGSYEMGEKWEDTCGPAPGRIAWKPGHVAICLNGNEIIEAAGISSGVRVRTFKITDFKKYLNCPEVNYSYYQNIGWNRDSRGWWFADSHTTYLKNGYYKLKYSRGEDFFYFDKDGYCIITDDKGAIKEPKL